MKKNCLQVLPIVGVLAFGLAAAHAQVATTTIVDTIYRADGTPAAGSLLVSWPEFTTSASQAVPAGKTEITIGPDGSVDFPLAPNAGAMPAGTYYTVVYHLSDGTVSTEYWTVPQARQTGIAAIRSAIMPATVSVQSASISYVNDSITEALTGYLPLTGGTLTGPLYLSEDPQQTTEAATKHYVDTSVAATQAGLGDLVSLNPAAAQAVVQPAGTSLTVNSLQSVLYAAGQQNGADNNGISNAMALPQCAAGGCLTIADPGYSAAEEPQGMPFPACFGSEPGSGDGDFCGEPWPVNTRLLDQRAGTDIWLYQNPVDRFGGLGVGAPLNSPAGPSSDAATAQFDIFDFDADYGNGQIIPRESLVHQFAGGHNGNYGSGWGKTNAELSRDKAVYFSEGQHSLHEQEEFCLGLGDCMGSPLVITFASGLNAPSDEGIHRGDSVIAEDSNVFQGPCTADAVSGANCSSGSQLVLACIDVTGANPACNGSAGSAPVVGGKGQGDQGEGRMAIDVSQPSAGSCATCVLIGGLGAGNMIVGQINGGSTSNVPTQLIATAGTFVPSSAIATTSAAIVAPTGQGEPGSVTVSITPVSGSFAPGVACISDVQAFEQVGITAATSTSVTASFRRPHLAGALLTQNGTCGQGLALNADIQTVNGTAVRTLLPLLGSTDDTHTYVNTFIGGAVMGEGSAALYNSLSGASATYNAATNLVTVTGNFGFELPGVTGSGDFGNVTGSSLTVAGASDSHYNGTFTVTATSANTFTYVPAAAPASATASGLTVSQCNCAFTMYPRAEVLSVYNQATKQVDGTLTLEPNTVPWATGDMIEEPHWHAPAVNDTHDTIVTFTPQAQIWGRGYSYAGMVSGDLHGFDLRNEASLSEYQGFGGSHTAPHIAYYLEGWWNTDFQINAAPDRSVFVLGCKPSTPGAALSAEDGCTRWNSGYDVFEFAGGPPNSSGAGSETAALHYEPSTLDLSYKAATGCQTTWGDNVGTVGSTSYAGTSIAGSANCGLFLNQLVLSGGTPLTGQTGTGASIVTATAPTLASAVLSGSTSVPSGQSLNVAGTLTVTGALAGSATGVTFTAGSAAGTGATASCAVPACDSISGVVSLHTGTAPSASGTLLTVGFGVTHGSQMACVTTVSNPGAGMVSNYGISESTSGFSLSGVSSGALLASTAYQVRYVCAEHS